MLRPYQEKALADLRHALRSFRRVLLTMPTGSGKGTLATEIIKRAQDKGNRSLFLVNRRTLVHDMVKRLERLGLQPGIIMGANSRPGESVLVASIDTLHRRDLPPAALVFVDEAHFCVSPVWHKVLAGYDQAKIIGMTATPIRHDGQGLDELFEYLVVGPSVRELIRLGDLVPTKVLAPALPDLTGVRSRMGDYKLDQLVQVMDLPALTGKIVEHWIKHASAPVRPTVVFAVSCSHGEHIRDEFLAQGIRAQFVSAETPDEERDACWNALETRQLEVVVSVGIISYGWDLPCISCAVLARPTQSLGLHLQQIGRILRPSPGKLDALIIDHAGNTLRHGFCDQPRVWTLEGRKVKDKEAMPRENVPKVCPECMTVWPRSVRVCSCGYQFVTRILEETPGELVEVSYARYVRDADANDSALKQIVLLAQARGYKPGWVWYARKELDEARREYWREFGVRADMRWAAKIIRRKLHYAE